MDENIKKEFDSICRACSLSESSWEYNALLSLLNDRLAGRFITEEEALSDFSALEIATMLRQLSRATELSISVNHVVEKYGNITIPILTSALTDSLNARIQKKKKLTAQCGGGKITDIGANMILNKGGAGGRAYLIPYPNGEKPQEVGFSKTELDTIIEYETIKKEEYKITQGNGTHSRELGHLAEWIAECFLPKEWNVYAKYFFVIHYLIIAGYLDFRGEEWLEKHNKKSINEQSHTVRDWIKEYHKIKKQE